MSYILVNMNPLPVTQVLSGMIKAHQAPSGLCVNHSQCDVTIPLCLATCGTMSDPSEILMESGFINHAWHPLSITTITFLCFLYDLM